MPLIEQIEEFISRKQMLRRGDKVVVSVSGGPDSVALLAVLDQLRATWAFTLSVVHVNHGLRGRESDEDADFVLRLCRELQVECVVKTLPVNTEYCSGKSSLQAAARDRRYRALSSIAQEIGAQRIATGHTADDQAETVVMWMVRGTGTRGLRGIPTIREPNIIRPLLQTTRSELMSYLGNRGLSYRMDSSNTKSVYVRNRIRRNVLPLLRSHNANIVRTLTRQVEIVQEEDSFLEQLVTEALGKIQRNQRSKGTSMNQAGFLELPLALRRRVIRRLLLLVGGSWMLPGFETVETILKFIEEGRSGSEMLVSGMVLMREYDQIHILVDQQDRQPRNENENEPFIQDINIPSKTVWPLTGQALEISAKAGRNLTVFQEPASKQAQCDMDTFTPSLTLRSWRPGDRFFPLGMGGKSKKLQDFFSDNKVPRSQRSQIPLLVAPEGIVWVGGYRMDHRFRITEDTRNVLVANLSQEPSFV
ncbi:MAG: tRNA lysidine(34) synthetase TilS [Nitrospirales bacterium]|nr:tRNA lysidine(34) synthetase TilS [Nitrospira sp.]MDR4500203.1 tRNA lysidine(34) synthetase TilS [Nitrospirales bacterium]